MSDCCILSILTFLASINEHICLVLISAAMLFFTHIISYLQVILWFLFFYSFPEADCDLNPSLRFKPFTTFLISFFTLRGFSHDIVSQESGRQASDMSSNGTFLHIIVLVD